MQFVFTLHRDCKGSEMEKPHFSGQTYDMALFIFHDLSMASKMAIMDTQVAINLGPHTCAKR